MFWIFVQIIDLIINHKMTILLGVWFLGMIEFLIFYIYYTKYKPYNKSHKPPISVVVSVFKEKPDLFEKCLLSIKSQLDEKIDELLIVFDGEDTQLQMIGEKYGEILVKKHGGKRSTLSYGCNKAKNEIIITIDSDTIILDNCFNELCKPFMNKEIGAVSASQRIFDANKNITSKFADYNELIAHKFMQKATSAAGNVPVLHGRCLAFRKEVWKSICEKYTNKTFRGKYVESGDDNDITILTILLGYKTFMQSTAMVISDCPRTFWKRMKQQYRFNRSSMRVTIADWVFNPKLISKAKLGFVNQITAIIFPFLVLTVWIEWFMHSINGYETILSFSLFITILLTLFTLSSTLLFRNILYLEKGSTFMWILFTFYSWAILNAFHVYCVLTFYKEDANLIQYSRNE